MTNRVYVGSLPYATTDAKLAEIFSQYGTVESARIITDRLTGRSKGFGFVEMGSGIEAQAAIEALNGSQLDGRSLTVNEARPPERRPPFDSDRRGGGGGRDSGWRGERRRW
ncbi:MAG: RNA recognition motif domain-containing protein [Candidatus Binatia bacterium]